jgi:hypothetical protein
MRPHGQPSFRRPLRLRWSADQRFDDATDRVHSRISSSSDCTPSHTGRSDTGVP